MPVAGCVLVLGATSGIARHAARGFALEGYDVVLAGRDLEEVEVLACDLRLRTGRSVAVVRFEAADPDSLESAVQAAESAEGGMAGALLAFGVLGDQGLAEADWDEARRMVESNYVHAVRALLVLARRFEAREAGWLAVLGSVAGDRGRRSNYVYGSAKAGLAVFLQGLRARLARSGVRVVTVKPGPVDTAMTFGMDRLPLLAQPEDAAAAIVKAVRQGKDEVYVPAPWRLVMAVFRAVPERIFKKLDL